LRFDDDFALRIFNQIFKLAFHTLLGYRRNVADEPESSFGDLPQLYLMFKQSFFINFPAIVKHLFESKRQRAFHLHGQFAPVERIVVDVGRTQVGNAIVNHNNLAMIAAMMLCEGIERIFQF